MHDLVFEETYQGHKIKIYHDPDPENPREWSNLGALICWQRAGSVGWKTQPLGRVSLGRFCKNFRLSSCRHQAFRSGYA